MQDFPKLRFICPYDEGFFLVEILDGVHARACTGGSIALAESDTHSISGKLPDGTSHTAQVRVTRPHALIMLKLLALSDRYLRRPRTILEHREVAS